MKDEPLIVINGHALDGAQALAVRVAISNWFAELSFDPKSLGDDEHGLAMTKLYMARLGEVLVIMSNPESA